MRDKGHDMVVFVLGRWQIVKSGQPDMHGEAIVFAEHDCYDDAGTGLLTNCWHLGDLSTRCILCDIDVPDAIQCLMALYMYGEGR